MAKAKLSNVTEPEGSRGRTLWAAKIFIDGRNEERLFTDKDDFESASATAVKLMDGSPAVSMTNAKLVSVERVARLWN